MRKYVKASSDASIRKQVRDLILDLKNPDMLEYSGYVTLDVIDGNRWAIVIGWMEDFEDEGISDYFCEDARLCGKVAYQPTNSIMTEYDYDWTYPYDSEYGEVWDTEVAIESDSKIDSCIDWWLSEWEEIKDRCINKVDFYEDSDAEIDLLDDESETDDIWESTNIRGHKKVMSASSRRNVRRRGEQAIKSSTGATRITDLPDDTVIRVDEVLDYARKYMKPEDIDHHGNGRGMDDLYLRVNDVSKWIVNHMDNTALVSKFVDNIDHVWWYELPFLYHD